MGGRNEGGGVNGGIFATRVSHLASLLRSKNPVRAFAFELAVGVWLELELERGLLALLGDKDVWIRYRTSYLGTKRWLESESNRFACASN